MNTLEPADWRECKRIIDGGDRDATDILLDRFPEARRKFNAVDKALTKFLAEVRRHFPDAAYYTASGGFHLMLGPSHDDQENGMQELIALAGRARIGDGDF